MKLADALQGVSLLFLDTAPVIYQVERHPVYFSLVEVVFREIDAGGVTAVTSPITLAECLVLPYRVADTGRLQQFADLIVQGRNTIFVPVDQHIGQQAAELRARYGLGLPDALQIACALGAGCEAFLTNDLALRRVTELRVLALDDLEI